MKLALLPLLLVFLFGLASSAKYSRTTSYEGEIVIRCGLENKGMADLLNNDRVDVWKVTADHADIRLPNKMFNRIRSKFPECSVLHSNVESLVGEFEQAVQKSANVSEWHEEYHTYDEIVQWYQELAYAYDFVSYIPSIGKSIEGRDQPAVRIAALDDIEKFQIYFQCQIHAREWISGATCMFIAEYLVENYQTNERVKELLDRVEFIFVPFVNPDGYAYTWNGDRLWRKNRRVNSGSSCRGVDLNRNYDDHWGESGTSTNPCSETYCGTSPASEPETQNTVKYFMEFNNLIGAIDWHSYSQLVLRPYGYSSGALAPDEARLKEIGDAMSDAIKSVHGQTYVSQRSSQLYPASGSAEDWFYSEGANVNNNHRAAGYTIELRDTGRYGFLLPPDKIIPTGEENVAGVLVFAEMLEKDPLKK